MQKEWSTLMKTTPGTSRVSRREFLRLAGLTVGGLLAGATLPAVSAAPAHESVSTPSRQTSRRSLGRVGVLLPASSIYPDLGRNFLAGLQLAAGAGAFDLVTRET